MLNFGRQKSKRSFFTIVYTYFTRNQKAFQCYFESCPDKLIAF